MRKLPAMLAAGLGLVVVTASSAAADLDGPCDGRGTFESTGETHDARESSITVPDEDTVRWEGAIDAPAGQERSHSGRIDLELPWPLPAVAIADWGTDSTEEVSESGTETYRLPAIAPRGVELTLTGRHDDTAGTCTGEIKVTIEGDPLDAPAAGAATLLGTAAAGAGLAAVARPKVAR